MKDDAVALGPGNKRNRTVGKERRKGGGDESKKRKKTQEEQVERGRDRRTFFFFLSPLFPPPAQGGARSELARACKKVVGSRGQRGRAEHARAPCSPLAGPDSSRGGREKRKKGKKKKKKRACSSSSPSRPPVLEGERGLLLSLSLSLSASRFLFLSSSGALVLPRRNEGSQGARFEGRRGPSRSNPSPDLEQSVRALFQAPFALFSARHHHHQHASFLFLSLSLSLAIPSICSANCSLECLARLRPRVVELARLLLLEKKDGMEEEEGWKR